MESNVEGGLFFSLSHFTEVPEVTTGCTACGIQLDSDVLVSAAATTRAIRALHELHICCGYVFITLFSKHCFRGASDSDEVAQSDKFCNHVQPCLLFRAPPLLCGELWRSDHGAQRSMRCVYSSG